MTQKPIDNNGLNWETMAQEKPGLEGRTGSVRFDFEAAVNALGTVKQLRGLSFMLRVSTISDTSTSSMEEAQNQVNYPRPSSKKTKKNPSPEIAFQLDLNACSKGGDLKGAVALYEKATSQNLRLNLQHVNSLLYICSNSVSDPSLKESAVQFGFRVYDHLLSSKISPNEATITAVARLAAANGEGDRAFSLVRFMRDHGIAPRLRTYDPALYWFCDNSKPDKAYEVEEHMAVAGVTPEEPELAALLSVSAKAGTDERVYKYLHKLRNCVRSVSEGTAKAIEDWFQGERASEVGNADYDPGCVKDLVLKNGGGFHGLGWIGKGKWTVRRGCVDEYGVCGCCGGQLACSDIDDVETKRFADSVAALAMEREAKDNFGKFQVNESPIPFAGSSTCRLSSRFNSVDGSLIGHLS